MANVVKNKGLPKPTPQKSFLLIPYYLLLELRMPPDRAILAVFDGHVEFLQLVADLVGERP
jgi:hypothetical protein